MDQKDLREKLKKLEEALVRGRISEETYKELKAKYEAELRAKSKITVEEVEKFNLQEHIERLKREGMIVAATIQKAKPSEPRGWKRIKWNPKIYVKDVANAIMYGGFSYFRYAEEARMGEVEIGTFLKEKKAVEIREKVPVLLEDESLEKVGTIKQLYKIGGWKKGTLYFTGRRFIFDVQAFEVVTEHEEVAPTLTMGSIWIKPDFSDILSLLGLSGFLEEGTIRKNLYNSMRFEIIGIKKKMLVGQYIASTWVLAGPSSSKTVGESWWVPLEEDLSLEQFYEKLKLMTKNAKKTKVNDLIAYAYACHKTDDVWIATSMEMGPRKMSELPYAYWWSSPIVV